MGRIVRKSEIDVPGLGKVNMEAMEKASEATRLRVAGLQLKEIAERVGYADESSVRRAIQRHVKRTLTNADVQEMRAIWGERYESVWRSFATKALRDKDTKAAAILLKAGDQAAKLWGLNVNEALMAGAAGVSAVADLAAASMLQANLIGVLHEVNLPMETIDRIIALLNERMGAQESETPEDENPSSVVLAGEVEPEDPEPPGDGSVVF